MWRTEYSCWLQWADLALPIITSGLEALLKTERWKATGQFVGRVPALASELGIAGIDAAFAESMYDARSEWVHGAHVFSSSGIEQDGVTEGPASKEERDRLAAVALLQDLLRASVRRCVEEPDFRVVFEQTDSIRQRWPLT